MNIFRRTEKCAIKDVKKMCANFLSGNVSELVGYTYPKLHKGKEWYVDFYTRDPDTNKIRRKKYWIGSELRVSERVRRATEIINVISKQIMEGWNPFFGW